MFKSSFQGRFSDSNTIHLLSNSVNISLHGPLAVTSVCTLKKKQVFIHSTGSTNRHTALLWPISSRGHSCTCTGQEEAIRAAVCVRTWQSPISSTHWMLGEREVVFSHTADTFPFLLSVSMYVSHWIQDSLTGTFPFFFFYSPSLFVSCLVGRILSGQLFKSHKYPAVYVFSTY